MAEQSMFWTTDGTGDGVSGGYTVGRLATIWKAALGDGVLSYQNKLSATGAATTTLAIDTGAAMVAGYLYENTTSTSIVTSTLSTGTYGLYIIANELTTALAVSRSAAGTTVAAKTTRLALNATTPTQPYIQLASVAITSGTITTITATNGRWATSPQKTLINYAEGTYSGGTKNVANDTDVTVSGWSTATSSDYVSMDGTTGVMTFLESGVYIINAVCVWDSNDTGSRGIRCSIDGPQYFTLANTINPGGLKAQWASHVAYISSPGTTHTIILFQNSGGTRTISEFKVKVTRG